MVDTEIRDRLFAKLDEVALEHPDRAPRLRALKRRLETWATCRSAISLGFVVWTELRAFLAVLDPDDALRSEIVRTYNVYRGAAA